MADKQVRFITIAITPETPLPDPKTEAEAIDRILSEDMADFVHLRHPGASREVLHGIIKLLGPDIRCRITLHDHHLLAPDTGCGGIHINSRNPFDVEFEGVSILTLRDAADTPRYSGLRISKSCHTLNEITDIQPGSVTYATLSPIFDSISKKGYRSNFRLEEISRFLKDCPIPVIALGGVTAPDFERLRNAGFAGAAMLGRYLPLFNVT